MQVQVLEHPRNFLSGSSEARMSTEIERKLTNILSADVFGYSRLPGL
jgi:hypothetical protein